MNILKRIEKEKGNIPITTIDSLEYMDVDLIKIDGISFNILKNEWIISKDESVNYITQFKKN